MTVVDANLLLYAYNTDVPEHRVAAKWLSDLMNRSEPVGLPWLTIWAFVRIATNSRIWPNPLTAKRAIGIVNEWLAHPGVVALNPGPRHAEILERLMIKHGVRGGLVTDAVLAALAIENGASLASTDQDFSRFPELRWNNPLDGSVRA